MMRMMNGLCGCKFNYGNYKELRVNFCNCDANLFSSSMLVNMTPYVQSLERNVKIRRVFKLSSDSFSIDSFDPSRTEFAFSNCT